jgi:5-formyltetrahydrofolate cyclo-ligase
MKNELRRKLIELRKNLSKKEVLEKSKKIKKRLYEIDYFKDALTVLFYVSYDNEVYTHDMIKENLASGKTIVVPKSDKENNELILSKLENWDDLIPGAYNILEPNKNSIVEVSLDSVEVVIVPGVGFDLKGNRIGHGKGYYDNLLKDSTKAVHIGLAFECQIVDHVPTEERDVPIDIIVTEKRVLNCLGN